MLLPAVGVFVVLFFAIRWMDRYTERYDSGFSAQPQLGGGIIVGGKDSTGYAYRRQTQEHHADTQRRAQEAIAAQKAQAPLPVEPRETTERTGG